MTNENKYNINGGVGFAGLLSLLFITLKLCDKIDWSWWWVLSQQPIGEDEQKEAFAKFCSNCGYKLSMGTNYCPQCGEKIRG